MTAEPAVRERRLEPADRSRPVVREGLHQAGRGVPERELGAVAVLVPAHNEAAGIAGTVESLLAQTYPHVHVVVISDNSTDATLDIAGGYVAAGVTVLATVGNVDKKAGAMHAGIAWLECQARMPEFVMTMDADSVIDRHFVARAVATLRHRPELGAVTGAVYGKPNTGDGMRQRVFCWLQEVEYAHYAAARLSANVFTLSGAGAVYRADALLAIRTIHDGHIFELGSRVEDVASAMHLRQLGWRISANEHCRVWTDVMPTHRELLAQRVGWTLGSLGEVRKIGVHWFNRTNWLRLLPAPLIQIFWLVWAAVTAAALAAGRLQVDWPRYALVFALLGLYKGWSTRHLGWKSALVCATNIPMFLYWPFIVEWVALSFWRFARGHTATW